MAFPTEKAPQYDKDLSTIEQRKEAEVKPIQCRFANNMKFPDSSRLVRETSFNCNLRNGV